MGIKPYRKKREGKEKTSWGGGASKPRSSEGGVRRAEFAASSKGGEQSSQLVRTSEGGDGRGEWSSEGGEWSSEGVVRVEFGRGRRAKFGAIFGGLQAVFGASSRRD